MTERAPVVLWIVGPPGVGKTTLVRRILALRDPIGARYLCPKPKATIVGERPELVLAGHYTGDTFDGADTVPYNGVAPWLEHWAKHWSQAPLTILDGDRFSHEAAVKGFEAAGALVRVAYLHAPEELLAARRAERGSNQNPAWLKGRVTKAARFALGEKTLRLNGELQPEVLATVLAAALP